MPVCTIADLKNMEMFLLRNLARHLKVNKWAYKSRDELIVEIMAIQGGEVSTSPPPIKVVEVEHNVSSLPINDEIKTNSATEKVKSKFVKKEVGSNPIEKVKNTSGKPPALYGILMELVKNGEEEKEVFVKAAQKHYPEKLRKDILQTLSVVKSNLKKQGKK